jgi:hypothetical protein
MKEDVLSRLVEIVGQDYVSNRPEDLYLYSRDPGAQKPRRADYVVMPRTVDEVQQIARLANQEKVPLTPMGAGLTLSALTVPLRGGIVLDMKRMDSIIEVNEASRYALIEAGVTQAALRAYLEKHHPDGQRHGGGFAHRRGLQAGLKLNKSQLVQPGPPPRPHGSVPGLAGNDRYRHQAVTAALPQTQLQRPFAVRFR